MDERTVNSGTSDGFKEPTQQEQMPGFWLVYTGIRAAQDYYRQGDLAAVIVCLSDVARGAEIARVNVQRERVDKRRLVDGRRGFSASVAEGAP